MYVLYDVFDFLVNHSVSLDSWLPIECLGFQHNSKKRATSTWQLWGDKFVHTANVLHLKIRRFKFFRQDLDDFVLFLCRRGAIEARNSRAYRPDLPDIRQRPKWLTCENAWARAHTPQTHNRRHTWWLWIWASDELIQAQLFWPTNMDRLERSLLGCNKTAMNRKFSTYWLEYHVQIESKRPARDGFTNKMGILMP